MLKAFQIYKVLRFFPVHNVWGTFNDGSTLSDGVVVNSLTRERIGTWSSRSMPVHGNKGMITANVRSMVVWDDEAVVGML